MFVNVILPLCTSYLGFLMGSFANSCGFNVVKFISLHGHYSALLSIASFICGFAICHAVKWSLLAFKERQEVSDLEKKVKELESDNCVLREHLSTLQVELDLQGQSNGSFLSDISIVVSREQSFHHR